MNEDNLNFDSLSDEEFLNQVNQLDMITSGSFSERDTEMSNTEKLLNTYTALDSSLIGDGKKAKACVSYPYICMDSLTTKEYQTLMMDRTKTDEMSAKDIISVYLKVPQGLKKVCELYKSLKDLKLLTIYRPNKAITIKTSKTEEMNFQDFCLGFCMRGEL